jgi:ketosteroid isomerase-like protein
MADAVDREAVDRWLAEYVAAWQSYDRDAIGALFADDVEYRYHPYDEPVRGREAVVESWLGEGDHPQASTPDEPGTFEAEYAVFALDGNVAVATGTSTYSAEPGGPATNVYDNCFLLRFDDDGRCAEFTEYFVKRPA